MFLTTIIGGNLSCLDQFPAKSLHGRKIRSQVHFFILKAQFDPNTLAMRLNRSLGRAKEFSDLLCGFSLPDEMSYLDFRWGQLRVFR